MKKILGIIAIILWSPVPIFSYQYNLPNLRTAADLAKYLASNNYKLTVVGLPKTIDNDVFPIKQSLGAWTAVPVAASSR